MANDVTLNADKLWNSLELSTSAVDRLILHEITKREVDGFDPDPNISSEEEVEEETQEGLIYSINQKIGLEEGLQSFLPDD